MRTALLRTGLAAVGIVAVGALAACGSSTMQTATPAASASVSAAASPHASGMAASAPMIHIRKFAYMAPMSVGPGAKVGVMNMDGEAHTVTSDTPGAFDVKADPGMTTTFTAPTTPGRYPFHCTYHSTMHGVLIVS
jgi:plastocyanin